MAHTFALCFPWWCPMARKWLFGNTHTGQVIFVRFRGRSCLGWIIFTVRVLFMEVIDPKTKLLKRSIIIDFWTRPPTGQYIVHRGVRDIEWDDDRTWIQHCYLASGHRSRWKRSPVSYDLTAASRDARYCRLLNTHSQNWRYGRRFEPFVLVIMREY